MTSLKKIDKKDATFIYKWLFKAFYIKCSGKA